MENDPSGESLVRAVYNQNGVEYSGQNLAVTSENEQTSSVDIAISVSSDQGSLHGTVRDRQGNPLRNATVFAYGGAFTSSRVKTNASGDYKINTPMPGIDYIVQAGGRTFHSDEARVTLDRREDRLVDFTLDEGNYPNLSAPTDLTAISWVSPIVNGRSVAEGNAYEAVKREFSPTRAKQPSSRQSSFSAPIEVQLEWQPNDSLDLYGWGIYRGFANEGTLTAIDLHREPIAGAYIDGDQRLQYNTDYAYQVTSLSVQYPDVPGSESPKSDRVNAHILAPLQLSGISQGANTTFNWLAGSGASEYVVYVYDQYPGIGVTSFWNNQSNPTNALSLTYTGPALQNGHRYYYIVLGLADSQSSRTLSTIGEYVP
jgi:hypothetical protein